MARTRLSRRISSIAALAGVLITASAAAALPPPPPPPENDPPAAAITASPNPAVVTPSIVVQPDLPVANATALALSPGTLVRFDASDSSDPDGSIARYQWDLDANGSFELTTTTPAASRRYSTPGLLKVRVRVTDNDGASTIAETPLKLHLAPHAAIRSSADVVVSGGAIRFDSNASSDDDGPIAAAEWDLDGNGTYETPEPGGRVIFPVGATFTGSGKRTVGLKVTDSLGGVGFATKTITVHTPPVSVFAVTPAAPVAGRPFTLDGSRSTDDMGPIARYEWDLDGDGTFETDGGTTPTRSATFRAPGAFAVGLRVTDGNGATASSQKIVVASAPASGGTGTTGGGGGAVGASAPRLRPASRRLKVDRRGLVRVRVTCPATQATCRFTTLLRGTSRPVAGARLALRRTTVSGGTTVTHAIRLSGRAVSALRAGRVIRAQVVVTSTGAAGATAVTRTAVRLSR